MEKGSRHLGNHGENLDEEVKERSTVIVNLTPMGEKYFILNWYAIRMDCDQFSPEEKFFS